MITHTVFFRLKHAPGSAAEQGFFDKVRALRTLPGVIDFKVLRQTGRKNDFTHGLSMVFTSEATYQAYDEHPEHVAFVNDIWLAEVADFLEIDYQEMSRQIAPRATGSAAW